jgi:aminocarboxymuconate-semialdehyde decarboxylase
VRRLPRGFVESSIGLESAAADSGQSRRRFIASMGGAALLAATNFSTVLAADHREVRVAGKRARVIDFHAHCAFPEVAPLLVNTSLARSIPESQRIGPDRLVAMDSRGIDVQALSVNQYWWYAAADRELAAKIVRLHDEGLSSWCKMHPDRFVGLSSVALQFPDLAADQLEYAVRKLGLRGASIGGHVQGEVPSDPKYDVFWAKAQELNVPVFMHPGGAENILRDGALSGKGDLGNVIGNPLETTFFLSHLIFDGMLDRFPRLKIGAAHGGGYVPSYLGRSEAACKYRKNAACSNRRSPSEYFHDQLFVDSMVFSAEGLRHLVAEVGASQIVYGSDMPYEWPDTIDIIATSPTLSNSDKTAILSGNLARLLSISV